MKTFEPKSYGPVLGPLVAIDRRRPLDAGAPNTGARAALDKLSPEHAFAHTRGVDREMAACCMAGVWLLHDDLDKSHAISQDVDTTSGSFWHAILHRREGDFWNSKYWFRRVGRHAVLEALSQRAAELAATRGAEQTIKTLTTGGAWDPLAFVDLCESVGSAATEKRELCLDIQQAEWEMLFDYCYSAAVGSSV